MRKGYRLACLALEAQTLLWCGAAFVSTRAADSTRIHLDVKAGSMEDALSQYAGQTHLNVLSLEEHVKNLTAPKVKGWYSKEEALRRLTAPSKLCFTFAEDHTAVTVDWCSILEPPSQDVVRSQSPRSQASKAAERIEIADTGELQSVTITGSHIKGPEWPVGPKPIVLTQNDLIQQGITRLDELDRILPQLFGGGPSQDTHLIGAETRTNTGLGSSYNIRGLGAGATLVLLNGRHLAPSGSAGSFLDNLNIPFSAVK